MRGWPRDSTETQQLQQREAEEVDNNVGQISVVELLSPVVYPASLLLANKKACQPLPVAQSQSSLSVLPAERVARLFLRSFIASLHLHHDTHRNC